METTTIMNHDPEPFRLSPFHSTSIDGNEVDERERLTETLESIILLTPPPIPQDLRFENQSFPDLSLALCPIQKLWPTQTC